MPVDEGQDAPEVIFAAAEKLLFSFRIELRAFELWVRNNCKVRALPRHCFPISVRVTLHVWCRCGPGRRSLNEKCQSATSYHAVIVTGRRARDSMPAHLREVLPENPIHAREPDRR